MPGLQPSRLSHDVGRPGSVGKDSKPVHVGRHRVVLRIEDRASGLHDDRARLSMNLTEYHILPNTLSPIQDVAALGGRERQRRHFNRTAQRAYRYRVVDRQSAGGDLELGVLRNVASCQQGNRAQLG